MEKVIYVANCIEHGDRFISLFQTTETNKGKLKEMGEELAMGWGGECISVKPWKPKVQKCVRLLDRKTGKLQESTERQWNNWLKKVPNGRDRYEVTKFEITEKTPTNVWDCDLSDKENFAINPIKV